MRRLRASTFVLAVALAAPHVAAQSPEPFPRPFVVEHHLVDGSLGDPVTGETVRDTYAGSFLVSERPDGSRTIVDFRRREVTEVRPKEGAFWSLSFGRFAELRRRLEEAEADEGTPRIRAQGGTVRPEIRVEEVREETGEAARGSRGAGSAPKRLRAAVDGGPSIDVWVDPSAPRLGPEAVAALAELERTVLGRADGSVGPGELLEAVRKREGGALAVRTRRSVGRVAGGGSDGPYLETVVTKVDPIAALAPGLVSVPEGLRRVPSPLEIVAAWAEDEAALRRRGRP